MRLLTENPHLMDDDHKLVSNVWYQDLKRMNIEPSEVSGYRLLEIISEGKLTNPESIRRSRQKVQEEFPQLRGKNYQSRKANQEAIKLQVK